MVFSEDEICIYVMDILCDVNYSEPHLVTF